MKNNGDILYIVMPAYNEGPNIQDTIETWIRILDDKPKQSRLIVADSGSNDQTHDILLKLQKKYSQLEILETANQYHGPKVIALYKYAIENGADYIFQTDSDGQTDPKEFIDFWNNRNKYAGIIGYRKKRGDGKARAAVEKVVCLLLRIFFGVKIPDANAPFRLMKSTLLQKYIERLPAEYDLPNIILTAYFVKFNENVTFQEISFKSRKAGVNSVNFKKIFTIGKQSLPAFWRFRQDMYRLEPGMLQAKRRKMVASLLTIACFAVVAFMIVSIAPAFPWNSGETMTDSSVFVTIGKQMQNGAMPYRDTFDHKGPLLYLINYLGLILNETKGIFVFEFFAIFATLIFMFKIARLKIKSYSHSIIITLVAFTPFIVLYIIDWGNLTEQYAMPFMAGSLYIFLKYFLKKQVSIFDIILTGLCFACVAMLRVNMASMWCIFCLAIIINNILNKKYSELVKNIISFTIGCSIIVIPITIWLIVGGAFNDFVDAYIKFNLTYSNFSNNGVGLAISYFLNNSIIFLSLLLAIIFAFRIKCSESRWTTVTYLISYIAVIYTACMSGNIYPHYGMILTPMTVWPLAMLYNETAKHERINPPSYILLSILLVSLSFSVWINVANKFFNSYRYRTADKEETTTVSQICSYIDEHTIPSDHIIVYGNWNQIYLRCNRLPASKYSYQFPISYIRDSITQEFYEDISTTRPKAIILQAGHSEDNNIKNFLLRNNYNKVWQESTTNGAAVYIPQS